MTMTSADPKADLAGLDLAIEALEGQRATLGDAVVDSALGALQTQRALRVARLDGSGAIALGDRSKAVGQDGVLIEGDLIVGEPPTGKQALEHAYLRRLMTQAGHLSLAGIDPAAISSGSTRLALDAVYTGLWVAATESPDLENGMQRQSTGERGKEQREPPSAVAWLDRHRHVALLGDPGGGKSTFVRFVAMCLAGARLGDARRNLDLLCTPLPGGTGRANEKPKPQPWRHDALLPVHVVLRDFAAKGLPVAGQAGVDDLWRFIAADLEAGGLADYASPLRAHLEAKGGLVLLDGLDEVAEAQACRQQVKDAVADFSRHFDRCRVVLTSRTYAYQRQGWRLPGFAEAVLAPFDDAQVRAFVTRWYAHAAALGSFDTPTALGRAAVLERAIFGTDRLRGLAERPLLLTLMASLHAWRGGTLPERREQLYAETVKLLLFTWERQRVRQDETGQLIAPEPSLTEWLHTEPTKLRHALNALAYEVHAAQDGITGTADIAQGKLVAALMRLRKPSKGEADTAGKPALLVDYLSQRSGILEPRGGEIYAFPHRTFQEYLAACHLTGGNYPEEVATLARAAPERWREVALLAGAEAASGTQGPAWDLIDALCPGDPPFDPGAGPEAVAEPDLWGALLAGQLAADVIDLERLAPRHQKRLVPVRAWLVALLASRLPPAERARAGTALATLGDPRFDADHAGLPNDAALGFRLVPSGRFRMGSDPERDQQAYKDEQPRHEVDMPPFFIARWPVTIAQLRAFVAASGFGLEQEGALRGPGNHPATRVSWHEARAYCAWLNERLRAWAPTRLAGLACDDPARELWQGLTNGSLGAGLPSEAEWEKAARGDDGRIFPWGNTADADRMSFGETGLGGPSTVGCFPRGTSPFDVEETSGTVWEWTRSAWGKDWLEDAEFGYPYDATDGREAFDPENNVARVLRGGAFFYSARSVRCAIRLRSYPAYRNVYVGFRVVLSPFFSDP